MMPHKGERTHQFSMSLFTQYLIEKYARSFMKPISIVRENDYLIFVARPVVAPQGYMLAIVGDTCDDRIVSDGVKDPKRGARYADRAEIDTGWKTVFVWLWVNAFYTHRQRRWIRPVGVVRRRKK